MSDSVLKDYRNLVKERDDYRERIKKAQEQLRELESIGTVKDKVTGGYGGIQSFVIEGFPDSLYSKKKKSLNTYIEKYKDRERQIIDTLDKVDTFINGIKNSRDRMVYKYFYLDGYSQLTIAHKLHIDQSVVSRTLDKYIF